MWSENTLPDWEVQRGRSGRAPLPALPSPGLAAGLLPAAEPAAAAAAARPGLCRGERGGDWDYTRKENKCSLT